MTSSFFLTSIYTGKVRKDFFRVKFYVRRMAKCCLENIVDEGQTTENWSHSSSQGDMILQSPCTSQTESTDSMVVEA